MKLEVEGKIGYVGCDDPPAEYYFIETKDGKIINVGFNANVWGGNINVGIPELNLPHDPLTEEDYKNKRCRITIEILED